MKLSAISLRLVFNPKMKKKKKMDENFFLHRRVIEVDDNGHFEEED